MAASTTSTELTTEAPQVPCQQCGDSCDQAAANGHLACLQNLHEHGFPWSAETCAKAMESGHLACLQYLHEHACPCGHSRGDPVEDHLACLQYADEHGCPDDPDAQAAFAAVLESWHQ